MGTEKASAFQRGLAALTQYIQREGTQKAVPRGHVEAVVLHGQEHHHKLGVWLSNTKTRRDKLTHDQRTALGIDWA
ncbi:helicase associated domain-containing protein [Streptomyces sp. NBC_00882]|nr:helicase associated domain-containing protein [Streptomyces sp. NBC_00882]WSZ63850.1 helicase associated domain-containing protein [Streptomyces canus]